MKIYMASDLGFFVVDCYYSLGDRDSQTWLFAVPECRSRAFKWVETPGNVVPNIYLYTTALKCDTSSDAALSWAKERLADCLENHALCRTTSSFVPTRLIDVRAINAQGDIALREKGQVPQGSAYVALSHCLGPNPRKEIKCFTLPSNLASQLRRIPWTSLPRTFQDAVDLTRRLGLRFLWIDCVCIVQDDPDEYDWEVSRMFHVYHNARLTLAAQQGRTPGEGIYSKSTPERETYITLPQEVASRLAEEDCRFDSQAAIKMVGLQTDYVCPTYSRNFERKYDSAPLFTRAWVFQERLVSPRVLVFAASDLAWECKTTTTCECRREALPDRPDNGVKVKYSKALELEPHKRHSKSSATRTESKDLLWWNLVETYSGLGITDANDKLRAIAAIAEELHMADRSHETYLAGLWSGSFLRDLLWITSGSHHSPRPKNTDPKGPTWWPAPTWSWASTQAPIRFLGHVHDEPMKVEPVVELRHIECRNARGNMFVRPDKALCSLMLRAKTARARLQKMLRDEREVLFMVEMLDTRREVVAYNSREDQPRRGRSKVAEPVEMVFMDFDPWPQHLFNEPSSSDSEDDNSEWYSDDESRGSEAADSRYDEEDRFNYKYGCSIDGASGEIELMKIAEIKRHYPHTEDSRHDCSSQVFMMLKRKRRHPNGHRRYERLGLVEAHWDDRNGERFIKHFYEATRGRAHKSRMID